MKELNTYITEKLRINKNSKYEELYSLEYTSSSLTEEKQLLDFIKTKTPIENINIKISGNMGVMKIFSIEVYSKSDYLWLLIYLYSRIAPDYADIKVELDDWLKRCIRGYNKKYKDDVHKLFTNDEIYNKYIEFLKYKK